MANGKRNSRPFTIKMTRGVQNHKIKMSYAWNKPTNKIAYGNYKLPSIEIKMHYDKYKFLPNYTYIESIKKDENVENQSRTYQHGRNSQP